MLRWKTLWPPGRLYSKPPNWDSLVANRGHASMNLLRRNFLKLAGSAIAASALPRLAFALDYPTRPTRIIAGFAAGGGVDIPARLIGQWLGRHLRAALAAANRPGRRGQLRPARGRETAAGRFPLL